MAHEVESMFYYQEVPWHGLGTQVDHLLTAEEAIRTAGLDWEVEPVAIFHNWRSNRVMIEDKKAMRRSTDGHAISVLSPKYKPVQNREAFKFFDDVVSTGEAKYETAGSLQNGKKIWILSKVKNSLSINGDQVDKYLLLMNGHDGTVALKMFFTPVRVVCMNTLTAAEAGAARIETFYAKHTGNIATRMERAKEILGLTNKFYENFAEQARYLASHTLPAGELPKLLAAAFGTAGAIRPEDVVDMNDLGSTRHVKEMVRVQALYEGEGIGLNDPGIRGTKWAAFNSLTEYLDHCKEFRGESPDDNRLNYLWFNGTRIKNRAWNYLMKN